MDSTKLWILDQIIQKKNHLSNFEVLSIACEQALSSFEHDAEYTSLIEDVAVSDFFQNEIKYFSDTLTKNIYYFMLKK